MLTWIKSGLPGVLTRPKPEDGSRLTPEDDSPAAKAASPNRERVRRLISRKDWLVKQYQFDAVMQTVLDRAGEPVRGSHLAQAYEQWGDPLSQANERFLLSCFAEAARCRGNILQCGASLATLLLGAVNLRANDRPNHVWCLEHDKHWANLIRTRVHEYGIDNVHVIAARPRMFRNYVWYAIDPVQLPGDFRLAICEGTRATPRGVIGLIERMHDRFAPQAVVMAKDVFEDAGRLGEWAAERGVNHVVVDKKSGFVKIAPQRRVVH
jgi:hypothetical protein